MAELGQSIVLLKSSVSHLYGFSILANDLDGKSGVTWIILDIFEEIYKLLFTLNLTFLSSTLSYLLTWQHSDFPK